MEGWWRFRLLHLLPYIKAGFVFISHNDLDMPPVSQPPQKRCPTTIIITIIEFSLDRLILKVMVARTTMQIIIFRMTANENDMEPTKKTTEQMLTKPLHE